MRDLEIAGGRIIAGPGWERDGEASLVRRALRIEARLAARTTLPPPLRHLAVTTSGAAPAGQLDRLKERLRARVPRLSVLEEGAFVFADGHEGRYLVVELELIEGLSSRQLHVLRADAGLTRHFVATVSGLDAGAMQRELAPMIESFRPVEVAARAAV